MQPSVASTVRRSVRRDQTSERTSIALPCGNTSNLHYPLNMKPKFCWVVGILCILVIFLTISHHHQSTNNQPTNTQPTTNQLTNHQPPTVFEENKIKCILQWTQLRLNPFDIMGEGQELFLKRRCPVNNCFITPNPYLLNSVTDFDAILFNVLEFNKLILYSPEKRSLHQKYVFVSRESPAYHNIYSSSNYFFNWTYTYKLDSDIYFGFIIIKNKEGEVIGPKQNMHWLKAKDMKPVDRDLRNKLKSKRLAAAWLVSNCNTYSGREMYALELQKQLAEQHLVLDIYSELCTWNGTKSCPKAPQSYLSSTECLLKIETDYYFYLSFENSLSEDYVTEKLLHAVQHYTVPIVYGGANYTRFLPDGSYLDIRKLGIRKVANKIVESIKNKEMYYDFFKWTNHYSYHGLEETPEVDYMCTLCRAINDASLVKQINMYEDIRSWWTVVRHND